MHQKEPDSDQDGDSMVAGGHFHSQLHVQTYDYASWKLAGAGMR